jgi:hypothetical protein
MDLSKLKKPPAQILQDSIVTPSDDGGPILEVLLI